MTQINPYLIFNGNCQEVMTFYKNCLGGELILQTVGESPMANQWPGHLQQSVLHASLIKDRLTLLGTDMAGPNGINNGNDIALSLTCSSEEELNAFFSALSAGGQINHPINDFFAGKIANITDKFGKNWILYLAK